MTSPGRPKRSPFRWKSCRPWSTASTRSRCSADTGAWRQRQVAEKVGIHPTYLSQIVRGRRQGSTKTLAAIARALNVGLDDLILYESGSARDSRLIGSACWARTSDPLINSQLLYQLS